MLEATKRAVGSKVAALTDRLADIASEAMRAAGLAPSPVPAPIPVRVRAGRPLRDR